MELNVFLNENVVRERSEICNEADLSITKKNMKTQSINMYPDEFNICVKNLNLPGKSGEIYHFKYEDICQIFYKKRPAFVRAATV